MKVSDLFKKHTTHLACGSHITTKTTEMNTAKDIQDIYICVNFHAFFKYLASDIKISRENTAETLLGLKILVLKPS